MEYLEVRGAVFRMADFSIMTPVEEWNGAAWVPSNENPGTLWTDGDVSSLSPEALASRGIPE